MSTPRAALATVVVLALVAVLVLLYGRGGASEGNDGVERTAEAPSEPPRLKGARDAAGLRVPPGGAARGPVVRAISSRWRTSSSRCSTIGAPRRGRGGLPRGRRVGRPGVRARGEVEDARDGTTDATGQVHLLLDRNRRRPPGEGLNHRLRVVPPKERDDLATTLEALDAREPRDLPYLADARDRGARARRAGRAGLAGDRVDRRPAGVGSASTIRGGARRRRIRTVTSGSRASPRRRTGAIDVWALAPWEEAPALVGGGARRPVGGAGRATRRDPAEVGRRRLRGHSERLLAWFGAFGVRSRVSQL